MFEKYTDWLDSLQLTGVIIPCVIVVSVGLLLFITRKVVGAYLSYKHKHVLIEVIPPAFSDKSAVATESLFTALHSLGMSKSTKEHILGVRSIFSVEVGSTKKSGIRFFVRCREEHSDTVLQLISSYVSDAKANVTKEYLQPDFARVLQFRQKSHYAYPLKDYEELSSNDPIGYITSIMTKLEEDEQLSLQIVFEPKKLRNAEVLQNKIMRNEKFMPGQNKKNLPMKVLGLMSKFLFGITGLISDMTSPASGSNYGVRSAEKDLDYKKQLARGDKPVRTLSYFEHELVESVSSKLKRPLFKTSIRATVVTSDKQRPKTHKKAISSALGLFTVPKYQSLKLKRRVFGLRQRILHFCTKNRMLGLRLTPDYFSANELAGLFHFPHSESAKTDNVVKSLSKTLPPPIAMRSSTDFDVTIGDNHHRGEVTPIGLTEAERQRHMFVIGGTGNGKTTMFKYQIIQDIKAGKGVAVLDPHGDLAEDILGYIPKDRLKDVVYVNPDDLDKPIGINLIELSKDKDGNPLTGNDLLREKDVVTESTVSVLRKIFSEEDTGGHKIEYVLRNSIHTAFAIPGSTIFTILELLVDKKMQRQVIKMLDPKADKFLISFWKNELGKAGGMQAVKMSSGVTNKIGRFSHSASARGMLEQEKSTINFQKLMDEKKILICNLSKGFLGEDTSSLFGITILAKLQLASLKRARQHESERTDFYVYVDEFQNFATMSFTQMLSEARKYKLFLTMAEQTTRQQKEERLVDIILANVGTIVTFRTKSPRDEELMQPLFAPYIEPGEISSLPAFNFYARVSSINVQEPVSGQTVVMKQKYDPETANKAKTYSRDTYGTDRKIEEEIEAVEEKKKADKKPEKPKQPTKNKSPKKTTPKKPPTTESVRGQAPYNISKDKT